MIIYYLTALSAMGVNLPVTNNENVLTSHMKPSIIIQNFVPVKPKSGVNGSGVTIPAKPLGDPGTWVTTNDYPTKELRELRQGTVGFRLIVNSEGNVASCVITVSSGTPGLDSQACQLISLRAKFSPAKNAQGKAVFGSFSSRVRWQIPQSSAYPGGNFPTPKSSTYMMEFTINADGSVSDCKVDKDLMASNNRPMMTPCDAKITFTPHKNAAGKNIAVRVVQTQIIKVTELDSKAPVE
jgi:TonB family protein